MDDLTARRVLDPARLAAVVKTGLLDTPADEAFDRLGHLAATVLNAPYAFVTLVDDQRSFWKACIGVDATDPADRQNRVDESFCQYVIGSGKPLIVGDTAHHPVTMNNPSIGSMGVAAWAGYPLLSTTGEILGTFCVVDTVVREWTKTDIEVLEALAAAANGELALREAVALAREEGEARDQANDRLMVLVAAGAAVSATLDIEEGVGRLAKIVVPMLGDWCMASVVGRDGRLRDVATWHRDPAMLETAEKFLACRLDGITNEGATYTAKASLQPVIREDGALEVGLETLRTEIGRQLYTELDPKSFGIFPLIARGHVNGTLGIMRGRDRPPMTPDEIELAMAIAVRGGLALDNSYLYAEQKWVSQELRKATDRLRAAGAHDHIVSRALQDAMLTQLPEPDRITLAARYRTASGNDQVGGDWYDAIVSHAGQTSLVVGDVAGHDITAAGIMGQLRNLVRAFVWDRQESPAARRSPGSTGRSRI